MSREKYNTEQSAIIIEALNDFNSFFSIRELEEKLEDKVAPATIYRQIKRLCKENIVRKQTIDGEVYYFYLGNCEEKNHFNLLCKKCNKMIHVDCHCLTDFCEDIMNEHGFEIDSNKLIISGYCEECQSA